MSLFKKAAKGAKTKTAKRDDKLHIKVSNPDFFLDVSRYEELQKEVKSAESEMGIIYDDLKKIGNDEWVREYQKGGKNPGSIILFQDNDETGESARFMLQPSDKYISINSERADELIEKYGDDIVEETITYSFNDKMLEKYSSIIEKLIIESEDIDEEDKESIIEATAKYSIKKGTIDKLSDYSKDIEEIFEEVRPVVSIKNVSVIKS